MRNDVQPTHRHRNESFAPLGQTLRKVVPALRDAEVPFLLGGSLAAWARGGPESSHDVDLMIRPEDADRALETLQDAGLRTEQPPEEWLFKAWDGDVLVDLIHCARSLPITDEVFERGDDFTVLGVTIRVMAIEDVLATKLLALAEHALDYEPVLQIARSLREQVDWAQVRERTQDSPYARAFFTLAEGLGLMEHQSAAA
jgi:predicted nucleotidyltransferase